MKNITTKIGVTAFAFALIFGLSVSDTFAFSGEKGQRGERTEKRGQRHKNISEEGKEFRTEQRAKFEEFLGLDEGELKELHESGEKMSETLDNQGIDKEDLEYFLEGQVEDQINFIIKERDLDDDQADKLNERISKRIERQLERWYN